jgi:hypothetical protein
MFEKYKEILKIVRKLRIACTCAVLMKGLFGLTELQEDAKLVLSVSESTQLHH